MQGRFVILKLEFGNIFVRLESQFLIKLIKLRGSYWPLPLNLCGKHNYYLFSFCHKTLFRGLGGFVEMTWKVIVVLRNERDKKTKTSSVYYFKFDSHRWWGKLGGRDVEVLTDQREGMNIFTDFKIPFFVVKHPLKCYIFCSFNWRSVLTGDF